MHSAWIAQSQIESESSFAKARINRFHKNDPLPWDAQAQGDQELALEMAGDDGDVGGGSGGAAGAAAESSASRGELFDPAYLEVDRILAGRPRTDIDAAQMDEEEDEVVEMEYLVKWGNMGYSQATWELASDLKDDERIEEFVRVNKLPDDAFAARARPAPGAFEAMKESPAYKGEHSLRSWQIDGVNQLLYCWYNRRGVILADEVRLFLRLLVLVLVVV